MKNMNEEKKKNKILIIIIIFMTIALIFTIGYIIHNINNETPEKNKIESNIKEDTPNEKKELIYTKYKQNEFKNIYNIPYINIASNKIDTINKEIDDYYKPIITEMDKANNQNEDYYPTRKIDYEYSINKNILSIKITEYSESDGLTKTKTYNIDIDNKKSLSNSDLLQEKNISEEEFINELRIKSKNKFVELYGTKEEWIKNEKDNGVIDVIEEEYDNALNNTLSNENININNPLFLNQNEKINVIINIYQLAGPETNEYNIILNL